MDVNAVLRILRDAAGGIESVYAEPRDDWSDELIEALEAFTALDGWISRGGALPEAWTVGRS